MRAQAHLFEPVRAAQFEVGLRKWQAKDLLKRLCLFLNVLLLQGSRYKVVDNQEFLTEAPRILRRVSLISPAITSFWCQR